MSALFGFNQATKRRSGERRETAAAGQRAEREPLPPSCVTAVWLTGRGGGGRPCRRMSSQHAVADGTDERTVQQENELQALASIFEDDFLDLRSKDPWKVTLARRVWLMLHPVGSSSWLLLPVEHSRLSPAVRAVFSGQEAPRGAPLPAAQWAEQRRGVLRDSGPAGQVPSSIPRRVSAHPRNCDTYSHCGLLSLFFPPQVIR